MAARPIHFRLRPPLRVKLSENNVEQQVLHYLRLQNWFVKRNHVGTFRTANGSWIQQGERGEPDYIATHYKFPAFWMEVKRPGKKPDPHQLGKHQQIRLIWRQPVVTIDSLEDLIEFLAQHERSAALLWRDDAVPGCASRP